MILLDRSINYQLNRRFSSIGSYKPSSLNTNSVFKSIICSQKMRKNVKKIKKFCKNDCLQKRPLSSHA